MTSLLIKKGKKMIGDRGETTVDEILDNEERCPHCGAYEDFDPCGHFEENEVCETL